MGKYFYLQCKRIWRLLPGIVCAVAALAAALALLFSGMVGQNSQDGEKVKIGMVGTTDDPIVQIAMTALQTLDDTRYSMELLPLTEPEAQKALQSGKIAVYAVIPEGFVEEAMYGRFLTVKIVANTGSADVVSLFKEEFTAVIGDMLAQARKGVYGIAGAMEDRAGTGEHMNRLALEYVELVLLRSQTYTLRQLGIADALGLEGYLLCGLTVLLLSLLCLPFAPLLITGDHSLHRLLTARGIPAWKQVLCEYSAYFLGCMTLALALAVPAALLLPESIRGQLGWQQLILPVFALTAISWLLYQLTREMLSGVLLQFLVFVFLAFVSGCMYPVYFFPQSIQQLAQYLPAGAARMWLAAGVTGVPESALPLLAYGAGSLLLAWLARSARLRTQGGGV